jgi:hypothetical protein
MASHEWPMTNDQTNDHWPMNNEQWTMNNEQWTRPRPEINFAKQKQILTVNCLDVATFEHWKTWKWKTIEFWLSFDWALIEFWMD